jgi:hypothetical protein
MPLCDDLLAQALALAAGGLPCFPCGENKHPTTPNGYKDATTAAAELRELWRHYPGRLIGVATGAVSGLDVLDLDAKHSEAAAWWNQHKARLPITRTHRTRSGGLHLLFRHAEGVRNTASRLAPGVDTRGTGGFVIWWPVRGHLVVQDAPLAPWPDWLLAELLKGRPAPEFGAPRAWSAPRREGDRARYVVAALRRAVQRVAAAPDGQRNDTLNAETFGLTRFIAEGALSARELAEAMAHAGLAAGLDPLETGRTIASALHAGVAA